MRSPGDYQLAELIMSQDLTYFAIAIALCSVTIFHYLAVAVAELDYFGTRGFLLLRHNADYVLQTCFHLLRHVVRSSVFDSFFCLSPNSVKPCMF